MTISAVAPNLEALAARERRGGRLWTAGALMVEALTVENYVLFFTDPYYLSALYRTLRVAVMVTAMALVVAFPLAYRLARTQSRHKNLLIMLVVLPLFVGN